MRVVVTGTDTGVGKTWVSAAIARPGDAYVKAAQTGDDDDAATVRELSGAEVHTLARYPEPLAPATAARRAKMPTVPMAEVAHFVQQLEHERVIIEGAGGLLVQLDDQGGTIADVAHVLDAPLIVVARAGLGTLNHTALTVEAIERRGLRCLGLVIGAWPRDPDLAAQCNLEDLTQIAPVLGRIPEGEFTTMEIPA
ncbi:dethiobiotin synthase [Solirubrobacter sp. CPCC 204708]|uniref:ATP-dependent dethiobiotin synthetase BioD n=1 Tax=Solirubrobacter deserti TaxID=2282478 RepID=A0ABT4RD04_9ACTN|nr:dethiobiotin synthase [Solirubrobacter deserti]MBE2317798.1 dethiobiotin synthase [Solirubrobacter deserti]MDA0136425.1 dethiobiotin synthase [Solirubrobacter deserti]